MKPPLIPFLIGSLLLGHAACSGNFLSMTVANKFYNWGWANVSYVVSSPPTLPSDIIFPTTVYYVHQNNWQNNPSVMNYQDGNQQAMRWHNTDVPWVTDATGAPYGNVTILIYPMNNYCNGLYFSFLVDGGNTWTNANAFNPPFKSLQDYNNGNPVTLNQWYRVTLDLAQAYSLAATANGASKSITDLLVWDPSNVHDGATYYVMAYLGDDANYVPPPVAPRYTQQPVYNSTGQLMKMTADGATFFSQGTDPVHPDYGVIPQWACSDQTVRRGYADLLGIPVNAFRDTDIGPIAMNLSAGTYYQDSTLFIRNMWIGPTDGINQDGYYDFNAWNFPHPAYTCMIYNADWYLVGDPTIANETLYVWMPYRNENANLYLAAWADYVKAKRTAGVNVAVNIRQTFYPYSAARGWAAVPQVAANCTDGAPKWLCPDIIFFSDAELGVLKEQQDRLLPLTDPVLNYFRETGFEPSMDMEAVVKSLVYFNNVPYALPAHVVSRGWGVNVAMLNKYNLKLPPPLSDWGSAWWTNWNMKKFNEYLTTMWEGGESALFILPPYEGTQTILSAKMNLLWGGSLFTPDGRCGMDERTELGLNETIMYWKSKPGMLRPPQPSDPSELAKWIAEPLKDNPMDMWLPNFVHPSWVQPWFSQGFDEYHCYPFAPGACESIYPPTGSAYVSAVLAGIPKSTHNVTKSYEALVIAIATNERLGVNAPQEASGVRGMSAWKTTRYAPELIAQPKTFAITLLDHATFGGYPAEQKPGWSEVFKYDPMELAFAEILYKNLTARQAMDRACYTVQWASRPPCTEDQWKVTVIDNTGNNKGTVNFTWVDGVDNICRTDLITTAALPAPIPKYMASTKIYNTSTIGKAILAVSLLGILIEVGLIAGFLWYRKADVIKAAAVTPSLLILGGGICTEISVIMRISFDGKLSWPQCFGTYWFFAIGFSSLLGSLAMKSYRIDKIFRSKGRMVIMSNNFLLALIGSIIGGNVIWLLMYQFWIDDRSGQVSQTLPNSNFELVQPDCPVVNKTPTVLLYLYNAGVMIVAAIYAFRTRNVVSSFNESLFTAAAILLITVITIVIIPVLQLVQEAQISLLLVGLGTFLATVLSTLIFAVPKLLMASGLISAPGVRESVTGKGVGNNTSMQSSPGKNTSHSPPAVSIIQTSSV